MKYYTSCFVLFITTLLTITTCRAVPISIVCTSEIDGAAQGNTTCLLSVDDATFLLKCDSNKLPAEIEKSNDKKIDILSVDFDSCTIIDKQLSNRLPSPPPVPFFMPKGIAPSPEEKPIQQEEENEKFEVTI